VHATMKRRYLVLALSAALVATPLSSALATVDSPDSPSGATAPSGDSQVDSYQSDAYVAPPSDPGDSTSDYATDPTPGGEPPEECSLNDPCAGI